MPSLGRGEVVPHFEEVRGSLKCCTASSGGGFCLFIPPFSSIVEDGNSRRER